MNCLILALSLNKLPEYKLAADHPDAARVAEFAAILYRPDVTARHHCYVRPDGWEMTAGAREATGLSDEHLARDGVPIAEVLDLYEKAIAGGYDVVVGHSAATLIKTMRGELRRAGRPDLYERTFTLCTMHGLTKHCGLRNSRGAPKWPSLAEAHQHLFGGPLVFTDTAPRAAQTADVVLRLFQKMESLGITPLPTAPKQGDNP